MKIYIEVIKKSVEYTIEIKDKTLRIVEFLDKSEKGEKIVHAENIDKIYFENDFSFDLYKEG